MLWKTRSSLVPRFSPFAIELSNAEKTRLLRRAAKYTLPNQVQRAKMILYVAEDLPNGQIADRLDTRDGPSPGPVYETSND